MKPYATHSMLELELLKVKNGRCDESCHRAALVIMSGSVDAETMSDDVLEEKVGRNDNTIQVLPALALEASAKDAAGSAAATLQMSATVQLTDWVGGKKGVAVVKWPSDSELADVQFFEPVQIITDDELELLEKMKRLPHYIQEFLLTKTDFVVRGSQKLKHSLCQHQVRDQVNRALHADDIPFKLFSKEC
jgi:hypothetical protein